MNVRWPGKQSLRIDLTLIRNEIIIIIIIIITLNKPLFILNPGLHRSRLRLSNEKQTHTH